jgi:Transposase and inactivated derivatives, IS1 family
MKCLYCSASCIKRGKIRNIQRYQCKHCGKFQQEKYLKLRISEEKCQWVRELTCEGCGISSISRLLHIAKSSVQRVIERVASKMVMPKYEEENQTYQIDELKTYCGNKNNELWVIYAINKSTGKVIDFCVGRRTKENIKKVVESVLSLNPRRIYTDGLNSYPSLIPNSIHRVFKYCTNKIERNNLTLRTHLKRLGRKTICYTRSGCMLGWCLCFYFYWGS